jgi:hypothetical protein
MQGLHLVDRGRAGGINLIAPLPTEPFRLADEAASVIEPETVPADGDIIPFAER